jgi:hypothetical protein
VWAIGERSTSAGDWVPNTMTAFCLRKVLSPSSARLRKASSPSAFQNSSIDEAAQVAAHAGGLGQGRAGGERERGSYQRAAPALERLFHGWAPGIGLTSKA